MSSSDQIILHIQAAVILAMPTNNPEILYLTIASFQMKLYFFPCLIHPELAGVKNYFKTIYRGFLSKSSHEKTNLEIQFVEPKKYASYIKKTPHIINSRVAKFISSKKIVIYYHAYIFVIQNILTYFVVDYLTKNKGLVLHASSALIDGYAFVFVGPSMSGKSTTVSLLRPVYKTLSDDRVILKKEQNGAWMCYQTRFVERDENIERSSSSYPLGGVFFIKKAQTCSFHPISDKNLIYRELFSEVTIDSEKTLQKKLLFNLHLFIKSYSYFGYLYLSLHHDQVVNIIKKISINPQNIKINTLGLKSSDL